VICASVSAFPEAEAPGDDINASYVKSADADIGRSQELKPKDVVPQRVLARIANHQLGHAHQQIVEPPRQIKYP
jgi:hypothetical protein